MGGVLEHNVLVVNVGRPEEVRDAYGMPVGRACPGRSRQIALLELDGTIAFSVGAAVERGRRFHRFSGHPVSTGSGRTIGFASSFLGYSCDDKRLLHNSGLPHARMAIDGHDLARVERLSRKPDQTSNVFTRFLSDRLRFEFITEDEDLRSMAVAVAFIDHHSRLDE